MNRMAILLVFALAVNVPFWVMFTLQEQPVKEKQSSPQSTVKEEKKEEKKPGYSLRETDCACYGCGCDSGNDPCTCYLGPTPCAGCKTCKTPPEKK